LIHHQQQQEKEEKKEEEGESNDSSDISANAQKKEEKKEEEVETNDSSDVGAKAQVTCIRSGIVLIRKAIEISLQTSIVRSALQYDHHGPKRKFWKQVDDDLWELNNARQGRGRIYDALHEYPSSVKLQQLCLDLTASARSVDASMPSITPTHLLTLYYTKNRKLGWHRDDGEQDGSSLQPVVSISLGNACDFAMKDERNDTPLTVRLESGDVLLFGGPARHVLHSVVNIHDNTCPKELLLQQKELAMVAPNEHYASSPPESFRMNLTFRHAPELFGKEESERFIYFARSARKFLSLASENGIEAARQISNDKRAAKAKVREERKRARKKIDGVTLAKD
jgi:alkylated DNA repair dioxygenase AlkB